MLGKNILWCARQHGHSFQVMLTMYGAWIEGSTDEDIAGPNEISKLLIRKRLKPPR